MPTSPTSKFDRGSDPLHDVRNQLTILKSKLYLAEDDIKKTAFYKQLTGSVNALSQTVHDASLLDELLKGQRLPERTQQNIASIFDQLTISSGVAVSNETSGSVNTDKELLYQWGHAITLIAVRSAASSVVFTNSETTVQATIDASKDSVMSDTHAVKLKLIAAIADVMGDEDGVVESKEELTTITCHL